MKETPVVISGSPEKTADNFLPNFSSGQGLVIDNAISCPVQQKYVHNASLIQGYTCNGCSKRQGEKLWEYSYF